MVSAAADCVAGDIAFSPYGTNGISAKHTNGQSIEQSNGHTSGRAEGQTNGHKSNGHTNGTGALEMEAHPDPIPLWINGQQISSTSKEPVIAPSTDTIVHHYSSASQEECIAAIEAASAAFHSWSKSSAQQRRQIFLKAADIFDGYKEEQVKAMIDETGEYRDFIQDGIDTGLTPEFFRDVAGRIVTVIGGTLCPGLQEDRQAMLIKEPYGVCLGMAPWNMPHLLGLRAFLAAIAVGNTAVLKGSELSPKCHWQLGRVLKEAGLPDGVLNIVFTRKSDSPAIVQSMIEHPAVKHINFTGSSLVGRIVAGLAGKNLKPCAMELGGKAPAIVLDDADIELSAMEVAQGAFCHSGQICMSTERVIVLKTIADEFIVAVKSALDKITPDKKRVLVSDAARCKTHEVVSKSVQQGAHLIHGSLERPSGVGARMDPVIVGGVQKGMDLYYTESFGPSVSLFIVESEEEALQIANDTEYGLASSVFSKDLGRAMCVAGKIESGAVHINSMTVHDDPCYPHGGVKSSGFGRFNGSLGLESFMKTKLISWKI